MTALDALTRLYGFAAQGNTCKWGKGSICNGLTVEVVRTNGEMVEITTNRYYCDGEVEADTHTTVCAPIGRIWEFIPEEVFR